MADPCPCLQCRITRELYGPGPVTTKAKLTAIASLMHVMADELADIDDDSVTRLFQVIVDLRASRLAQRGAGSQQDGGLASAEVAGHG